VSPARYDRKFLDPCARTRFSRAFCTSHRARSLRRNPFGEPPCNFPSPAVTERSRTRAAKFSDNRTAPTTDVRAVVHATANRRQRRLMHRSSIASTSLAIAACLSLFAGCGSNAADGTAGTPPVAGNGGGGASAGSGHSASGGQAGTGGGIATGEFGSGGQGAIGGQVGSGGFAGGGGSQFSVLSRAVRRALSMSDQCGGVVWLQRSRTRSSSRRCKPGLSLGRPLRDSAADFFVVRV